jgi:alkylation response protein AidB-like acyl-CoA dehydrogenase
MQVHGGYGTEFDVPRRCRDDRPAAVAAGISQTQRNLIAG